MTRPMRVAVCFAAAVLLFAALAAAQEKTPAAPGGGAATTAVAPPSPAYAWGRFLGTGIGAGLTILGAAFGIGWIGSSAVDAMARQPETATNVQGAMIIAAALIE